MILDMRTMYVVVAVTSLVLGGVQLLALATRRFGYWTAWWGLSNVLVGFGTFAIALRGTAPDVVSIDFGNLAIMAGSAALAVGIRAFAGGGTQWTLWALVALAVLCPMPVWRDPSAFHTRIAYLSAISAFFDAAVLSEGYRLARMERLSSAWILVGLFALTMLMFTVRAAFAAVGLLGSRDMFSSGPAGLQEWLALTVATFVTLRGITMMMMVSERDRNALLALARRDSLTGVLNRNGLKEALGRLVLRRRQATASLLLIDIDRFKILNDTHGHAAGDHVLRLFASLAQLRLRSQDILARQGGDEFVAVLPETRPDEAYRIAERIRQAFASTPTDHDALQVRPTLSIGIATGDLASEGLEPILRRADDALYRSKRQGRNRIEILTGDVAA